MSISFTTTINYNNPSKVEKIFNRIEDFFNLSGRKVIVFDKEKHLGVETQSVTSNRHFWFSAAKIVAYLTLIIPAIMLVGKAIGRGFTAPVQIDSQQGLDWATQQSPKMFNKILIVSPVIMSNLGKISTYIFKNDDVQSSNFMLKKYPQFLERTFIAAISNNSPKILNHLWNQNIRQETAIFEKSLRYFIGLNNKEAMYRLIALQEGSLTKSLGIAIELNKLEITNELLEKMK